MGLGVGFRFLSQPFRKRTGSKMRKGLDRTRNGRNEYKVQEQVWLF